jgi:hypothetical protein
MHIIQIQTIGAWKGAWERSGKPWSCYLVNSHAFYKEWADISRKCVAIVNHKHVIYWFYNCRKMKYMLEKHDGWHGAMVWPLRALVKIWEGLAYVVMHALRKSNHHRGSFLVSKAKSPRLKANPNFLRPLSLSFFSTMNIHHAHHFVQIWHFSRLIYHI